ncbi:MAG TPA: hypothetical protein VHR18_14515 [Solirubrobacterales bacterium]|jgi:hypothetical protein|nr:hypothetical protein [Solirubrobacterales bacterium]
MASENPKGDGEAVALEISPRNIQILRPILEMVRDGAHDDFSTAPVAARAEAARADEHAYRVLLAALDHGTIVPAPHICRALGELAESVDEANEYERASAEHDALADLHRQVCGVGKAH